MCRTRLRCETTLATLISISIISFSIFYFPHQGITQSEFQHAGKLQADSFLTGKILQGKYHTVDSSVYNDGLFNHYKVTSPFGDFSPNSTSALVVLIHELNVIAAMREISTETIKLESNNQSSINKVPGKIILRAEQKKKIRSTSSGVIGLFNLTKESIGNKAHYNNENSKLDQFVGFSKSKGIIASQYGVSRYSINTVLQNELNRLAMADYFGNLVIEQPTSSIRNTGGTFLAASDTDQLFNDSLNTTLASELWLQNQKKLLELGIPFDTVGLFLNNPHFSPASITQIVKALEGMQSVNNLELYLKIGLQANDPDMSRTITEMILMTSAYHQNTSPLKKVHHLARLAYVETEDNKRVIILPVDHILWTPTIQQLSSALKKETGSHHSPVEMWISGDFSTKTTHQLSVMNWKLHPHANRLLKLTRTSHQ